MIRADYFPYLDQLKSQLFKIGAIFLEDSELSATFLLPSGWLLNFDCERYSGPSWTISITPSRGGKSYVIWLLMKVLEKKTGNSYGKPTIENQVKFLDREKDLIFDSDFSYEKEYKKINEGD